MMNLEDAAAYLRKTFKSKHKAEISSEVLCLCLCQIANMERDKTRIGRLIYAPKRKGAKIGDDVDDSQVRNFFDKIYSSATKRYILTFRE